ncbi:hypothetical protein MNBD_GAMMA16-1279 [hydrothermal vent metagenome]|uniref:TIGR02281 family clan AA aspartic protease n=1 Tax=hydrothermal vent metagenome TaxID=652676 RepID=A0A3B0Z832_9ZZZZ
MLFVLIFVSPASIAVQDITVVALFTNKAVVMLDGKRRVLVQGIESPEGVTLLSSDSETADLMIDGKKETFYLGMHISTGYVQPATTEVKVWGDRNGMYFTTGSINGHLVNFLVDTGATSVAMNANQAQRLGIDFRYIGQRSQVSTASGIAVAYNIKLNSVKVGEIELRNINAVVIDGDFPVDVLLGMSFLGSLEMMHSGKALLLRKNN